MTVVIELRKRITVNKGSIIDKYNQLHCLYLLNEKQNHKIFTKVGDV